MARTSREVKTVAELIHMSLHEAGKQNEYGECLRVSCALPGGPEECPHYAEGGCLQASWLNFSPCVYARVGVWRSESTKRGKAYWKFVRDVKAEMAELAERRPSLVHASGKLLRIGDHVTIPFPHADMCEGVPFLRHSHVFLSGMPWVKAEDFTVETVLALVRFRPHALMGGEIKDYQGESVPKFLYQLKLRFSDLWEAAAELEPSILERTPGPEHFAGKLVPVSKLSPGEVTLRRDVGGGGNKRSIVAPGEWDGERVTVTMRLGDLTWLAGYDAEVTVTFAPVDATTAEASPADIERLWAEGAFEHHRPSDRPVPERREEP